jgi:hypothetical protein
MQAYKILDNLIPQSMAEAIQRTMLHTLFAYNPSTINDMDWDPNDSNIKPTHQFIHPILHADGSAEDNLFEAIGLPILWFLEQRTGVKFEELHRINTTENNYAPPHWDLPDPGWVSMVYYINDSDGDTKIFDKYAAERNDNLNVIGTSTPKAGSAVIFDSNRWHASSNPINFPNRYIINFIFRPEMKAYWSFMNE